MLTTNLRTHTLLMSDDREFHITNSQYLQIKQAYNDGKPSELFKLSDADTGKTLFEGKLMAIKEFREKSSKDGPKNYYCNFGETHPMQFECDCKDKTGLFPHEFKAKAIEMFNAMYMQDLTRSQKNEIYAALR